MFAALYQKVLSWSRHRHAPRYLAALSFAESSFFPIPPDVMLAPMALANRARAWSFAWLTTVMSVLGGIFGYLLGLWAFAPLVEPVIDWLGYQAQFLTVQDWFTQWGFWIIFIAGFSPIPYKLFTVTAGLMAIAFLPFVVASFIGRGARFFLVSALMVLGGQKLEDKLHLYVDRIGWAFVAIILIVAMAYWLL